MRFALTLFARSGRWIPPALILVTWVALVVANPGSALDNASNLFFAVMVVALWCTIAIGNVDDDPHRDLCAAAVGGPGRLFLLRQTAAVVLMTAAAAVVAVSAITSGSSGGASSAAIVAGTVGLLVSGVLLGIAVGGLLHRPVLRSPAWTVVAALVTIILVALLPPVRDVLRDADHARIEGVGLLCVASVVVAALAAWAGAVLTTRRS